MTEDERKTGVGTQYRRNRTISGIQKEDIRSDRGHVHHLTRKRRKAGGVFLLSLSIVVVLGILVFQLVANVAIVNLSSKTVRSVNALEQSYQETINRYFSVHPIERLRFVLNDEAFSTYLSTVHPEVKSAHIIDGATAFHTGVGFEFREPVAGWQIKGQQHFVDTSGIVFEENYYTAPSVHIVDESGIDASGGGVVASGRLLSFVGRVVSLSEGRGYSVEKVVLPSDATRRLDVRYKTVRPTVRYATDRAVGEQVSDATRSLKHLASRGQSPSYIDVRVSGRTVYK